MLKKKREKCGRFSPLHCALALVRPEGISFFSYGIKSYMVIMCECKKECLCVCVNLCVKENARV